MRHRECRYLRRGASSNVYQPGLRPRVEGRGPHWAAVAEAGDRATRGHAGTKGRRGAARGERGASRKEKGRSGKEGEGRRGNYDPLEKKGRRGEERRGEEEGEREERKRGEGTRRVETKPEEKSDERGARQSVVEEKKRGVVSPSGRGRPYSVATGGC